MSILVIRWIFFLIISYSTSSQLKSLKNQIKPQPLKILFHQLPKKSNMVLGLYLDDEACERLANGILLMRKIIMHPSLRSYYKLDSEGRPIEIFSGYHIKTIDQLKNYLKSWSSFGHHISGTAKMCDTKKQSASMNNGVVNSKLRVLNIDNLRVVDTSIYSYPELHGYNTSRAAYVVGEIAADIIIAANKKN